MAPYLRDEDLLWLDGAEPGQLSPGSIIFAIREDRGDQVVHRVLTGGKIKGDRNRDADGLARVLGRVRGRVLEREAPRFISYDRRALRALHRLQAWLSAVNERPGFLFPRLSSWSLSALGALGRKLEETFLSEPMHQSKDRP
jgi:hypothetical protein